MCVWGGVVHLVTVVLLTHESCGAEHAGKQYQAKWKPYLGREKGMGAGKGQGQ